MPRFNDYTKTMKAALNIAYRHEDPRVVSQGGVTQISLTHTHSVGQYSHRQKGLDLFKKQDYLLDVKRRGIA